MSDTSRSTQNREKQLARSGVDSPLPIHEQLLRVFGRLRGDTVHLSRMTRRINRPTFTSYLGVEYNEVDGVPTAR